MSRRVRGGARLRGVTGRTAAARVSLAAAAAGVLLLAACSSDVSGQGAGRAARTPLAAAGSASGGSDAAPAGPAAGGGGIWGAPVQSDDFGGSGVDPAKWFVYDSPNGAFPRVPAAVSVGAGLLRITGGTDASGRDVSGGLSSLLHQTYGRWEARFRVEEGAGFSAVVLLWPQTQKWPDDGEIDLVEVQDGTRRSATMAVHNGPRNDTLSIPTALVGDFTAWHTVAVEWLPTRLSYYLDGRNVFTVLPARHLGGALTIPSTAPMHMALQLDTGCHDAIPCRDASTPAQVSMYVDWIRAYPYRS
ncbi:Glycoside hydrolase family 16 [Frankia canadensis]|uniref:Glycoside hydrolase family 16 n=1 Tax=Frankia canadensis TaxID=1836972 RepID=A0A2I2KU97_9ACTN|nr:glycoside hydrolase family 16 protein [Frankia canadensis]SNQ49238.1 Glycoside hydrolase family 16 [Frankia canadensis]SOU56528.1 Glycoside hydrolase family 16 [Frankia canadensis]